MTPTRSARAVRWIDNASVLQTHLEERLADHSGRPRSITTLDRRLSPYSSSFRLDELNVHLDDGSCVQLVLKDLGRATMVEEARSARPDFLYDSHREIDAYQWILPHAPAGTPTWYGAISDDAADRHWLFLERIDGVQLKQIGAFGIWERTAAWAARFHAAFSPLQARRLAVRAGTLVYDEAFYSRWLQRARQFVDSSAEERRIVEDIARQYGPVIDRLTKLPQTLIHGELYPGNVLVAQQRERERICPVDWEMTALGPGLVDLAALSAGWAEVKQRALARAYITAGRRGNSSRAGAATPVPRAFAVDLDCCRLFLAVRMLGWSDNWQPPPDHAHNWLAEAASIVHRLQR